MSIMLGPALSQASQQASAQRQQQMSVRPRKEKRKLRDREETEHGIVKWVLFKYQINDQIRQEGMKLESKRNMGREYTV